MPGRQGPSAQLLLLAGLGCLLILYRLSSTRSRIPVGDAPLPPVESEPLSDAWWTRRIVAVGDLHGDLSNAQAVLRRAGVIDANAGWVGKETVLVQTGDIVDRGTDTIELYRMFQRLRSEAAAVGGEVVSILGNHEIMNAIGDWRYVTPDDIKTFGGADARQEALSDEGWIGREWLSNYTVTAKVPLTPFTSPTQHIAFSHGSLHPDLPLLTPFPARPNALMHSLLQRALHKPLAPPYPPHPYPGLPRGTTADEARMYGEDGVVWWRGLAIEEDEARVCAWARTLQERLGVRRVVGGHTPNFEQIVSRCNGDVIIIDTGISSAYGGVLASLEITYSLYNVSAHDAGDLAVHAEAGTEAQQQSPLAVEVATTARDSTLRMREVEVVKAVYPDRQAVLSRREGVVVFDV